MKPENLIKIRDDSTELINMLSEVVDKLLIDPASLEVIQDSLGLLQDQVDKLIETINSDPDKITRKQLEDAVDYCTEELYGENYVKVDTLYGLFTLKKEKEWVNPLSPEYLANPF